MLRNLVWMVAILVAGWTVGWYLLAEAQKSAVAVWFDDRAAKGWQADYSDLAVGGFPAGFNRRIEAVKLADPATGWAWEAPWLDASSPAWLPNRIELSLPPEQRFAVPGERITIRSQRFEAALKTEPNTALEVIDGGISLATLEVESSGGWLAGAEAAEITLTRRAPGAAPPHSYSLDVDATTVLLPKQVMAILDPAGVLSPKVERFTLEGNATLTRPLDREMVETGAFDAQQLKIKSSEFRWGDMALTAKGALETDADGRAVGKIKLRVTNWKRMLEMARDSKVITEDIARAIASGLRLKERIFGGQGVGVTLEFGNGAMRIGPVRIADAPRLARPGA